MARLLYTVDSIIDEVRSMLDEENTDSIDTNRDILPALNRAQDFAFDILARKYPEPLLQPSDLPLVAGQAEYDIPEDIFEDRVLKLEISFPNGASRPTYREVRRISYRDVTEFESSSTTSIPQYYVLYGRKLKFIPTPNGTYPARMWTLRQVEQLVRPQGRISRINEAGNYILVDSIGSDVSTEVDNLQSYVNIVDGQTGEIKGTMQVQIASDNKITFRSSPFRSSVLNRDITADIADIEVNEDDYICNIAGTCVVYYGVPIGNFLIQYAISELTRKLGGEADLAERVLEKFEKQVERTWVKRENALRIPKRSGKWPQVQRRLYWSE